MGLLLTLFQYFTDLTDPVLEFEHEVLFLNLLLNKLFQLLQFVQGGIESGVFGFFVRKCVARTLPALLLGILLEILAEGGGSDPFVSFALRHQINYKIASIEQ